jgi:hypothetical protein
MHWAGASEHRTEQLNTKEIKPMSEEGKAASADQDEAQSETENEPKEQQDTVTEEIKVQAQDLFQAINAIIREGTARRITVMRNDRTLLDIPLVVGIGASVILAMYMPLITALAGVGALVGGCTLRIEREDPPEES